MKLGTGQKTALIAMGLAPILAIAAYFLIEASGSAAPPASGAGGLPVFLRLLAAGHDLPALASGGATNAGGGTDPLARAAARPARNTNLAAFSITPGEESLFNRASGGASTDAAGVVLAFCRLLDRGDGPALARLSGPTLALVAGPLHARLDRADLVTLRPDRIWLRRPLEGHLRLADFRARARILGRLPIILANNTTASNASGLRLGLARLPDGTFRVTRLVYDSIHPLLLAD